jgi:hypothetical protein
MEGGQLGGIGGHEAGRDAAPVADADDSHTVLAVGVPIISPRPECRSTEPPPPQSTLMMDRPRATPAISSNKFQIQSNIIEL